MSGTSISFGSAAVFETANTSITNSTSIGGDKVVIVYSQATETGTNPATGKYAVGTVSGTSITFDTAVTFNSDASWDVAVTSPADDKVVISWGQHYDTLDNAMPGYRQGSALLKTITQDDSITIQGTGTINIAQGGLTPGQEYFVQVDGTIALTADYPSVSAGIAISSTELIVKG